MAKPKAPRSAKGKKPARQTRMGIPENRIARFLFGTRKRTRVTVGIAGVIALLGWAIGKKVVELRRRIPPEIIAEANRVAREVERVYEVMFPEKFSLELQEQLRGEINGALAAIYWYAPELWPNVRGARLQVRFGDPRAIQTETSREATGGVYLDVNAVTRLGYNAEHGQWKVETIFDADTFARNPARLLPVTVHEFGANVGLAPVYAQEFAGRVITREDRMRLEIQSHEIGIRIMERMKARMDPGMPGAGEILAEIDRALETDRTFLQRHMGKGSKAR